LGEFVPGSKTETTNSVPGAALGARNAQLDWLISQAGGQLLALLQTSTVGFRKMSFPLICASHDEIVWLHVGHSRSG
jgi:hypothetical protein